MLGAYRAPLPGGVLGRKEVVSETVLLLLHPLSLVCGGCEGEIERERKCTHIKSTALSALYTAALKKFLKKNVVGEELAVLDKKLGGIVQEKLGIPCIYRCASTAGPTQCMLGQHDCNYHAKH